MTDVYKPKVSICIPVYNNANFTKLALEGLSKLPSNYEIIIVDNASTDHTFDVLSKFLLNQTDENAKISVYTTENNLGFSGGNNKAYQHASGEYIIFLNNDIRIEDRYQDWPEIMLKWAEKGYIVGTQGGVLDKSFNFIKEGTNLPQTELWYMSGWCLCAKKEVFDKLMLDENQLWNKKFFPGYFEDVDLSFRAKKISIPFKEVQVPIHHFGRVTGKTMNLSYIYKKSQKTFREIWKDKL